MPKFKCHGQTIEAPTFEAAYAIRFDCSVAQAIADREEPMTDEECEDRFLESTGRMPDSEEMAIMRPESLSVCIEEWRHSGVRE